VEEVLWSLLKKGRPMKRPKCDEAAVAAKVHEIDGKFCGIDGMTAIEARTMNRYLFGHVRSAGSGLGLRPVAPLAPGPLMLSGEWRDG